MKVLKVKYSGGCGWLVCHGEDLSARPDSTEEQRMEYVRSEAASFVAEDIDCGGVEYSYFPAQVGTLSEGQTFSAHAVCGDKRALEAEIVKALAGMDEGQHVEVYDSDGNVHTIEAGEMTAEECQALSEFDGW